MTDNGNTREIVLDMLIEVMEGDKYSHTVLSHTLKVCRQLTKQDRAFISRLFTGTVKSSLTLDYIMNQFSTLPAAKMKPLIRNLLRMGVYQIIYMDQVPVSAACNEAVNLAKKRGFTKLSGFINAVLRNVARNTGDIKYPDQTIDPAGYLEISYSYPKWLVSELLRQYDFKTVETMLSSSLNEKETTIRCNQCRIKPEDLKDVLRKEGVTAEESPYLNYAFKIRDYDSLDKLDSFRQGLYAVQDVSSMLVCEIAGILPDSFVIDVCAAPGGKALHAAEKALKVSARDVSEYKILLIKENISRLGAANVETAVWDATQPDEKAVGQADIVIADLPCSGLGVTGKKPDIKYKLTQNQMNELVLLQRRILGVVQSYVKDGGILIYSTCTVNRNENQKNRTWFLENFDFQAESIEMNLPSQLRNETAKEGWLQLLQGIHDTDGFFLSKFRKNKRML